MSDLMLFSGSASKGLTDEVAELLGVNVGRADTSIFSDGETKVEILDNQNGSNDDDDDRGARKERADLVGKNMVSAFREN